LRCTTSVSDAMLVGVAACVVSCSCDDPVRSMLPMVAPQPASAKAAATSAAREIVCVRGQIIAAG
jgi:hypothetical protein